jgi:hypothetical protein
LSGYFRIIKPIAEERDERRKQIKQEKMLKKERKRRSASKGGQVMEEGMSNQTEGGKDTKETGHVMEEEESNQRGNRTDTKETGHNHVVQDDNRTLKTEPLSDVQTDGQGDGQSTEKADRYNSVREMTIAVCLLTSAVHTVLFTCDNNPHHIVMSVDYWLIKMIHVKCKLNVRYDSGD